MLLEELYAHYGNWTNLTRSLSLANNTYQHWRKKGYIPFKSQLLIENKTKGKFKASEKHAEMLKKENL